MDYKKIIKSRKIREIILGLFSFVPDKVMIKIQFKLKTGRKLNLKNPTRYSEKIQWYKIYYREPLMKTVVDKISAKKYVEGMGLSNILIPTIAVYTRKEEIVFDSLPDRFVAKDTLGGGGSSVIVCLDKKKIDEKLFVKEISSWLKRPSSYRNGGREWVYGGRHRIIVEEYLEHDNNVGIIDYKFLCFNGRVEYLYVITNRVLGKSAELGIYDRNFNKIDAFRRDEKKQIISAPRPKNYYSMVDIAEKLSSPFPYARIDLYNISGKIYFGEITLTDGSGYMRFDPDSFDFILGEKFVLPDKKQKKIIINS